MNYDDSMKVRDIRDSVFSVLRGVNPTTEQAIAGLLNAVGAVIAEKCRDDQAERQRLIGIVEITLPRYIDAYTVGPNPVRK